MDTLDLETQQCKNCGMLNTIDRALCSNCQTPLTAYAGQLRGQEFDTDFLKAKIVKLDRQPTAVKLMTVQNICFAIFWPLASAAGGFFARAKVNSETTNYLSAAFSAVGSFVNAIVLIPIAMLIIWLAWGAWSQRTWAWGANLGVAILFGLACLIHFHFLSIFWLILIGYTVSKWMHDDIRTWFGQL